jgi:hypothetical protein
MARELRNEDAWRQCGFERPPSRWTLSRFITNFALVAENVFITLVHKIAEQVPLGKLFHIDGTDIPVDQRDGDADWNYDHTVDDYYYGYGCCVVTAADNIPVAAAFTSGKKVNEERAVRVTRDALAVDNPCRTLTIRNSDWRLQEFRPRTPGSRGRVRVKSHVFITLCLRLAVVLANHHRGNDVASPPITL